MQKSQKILCTKHTGVNHRPLEQLDFLFLRLINNYCYISVVCPARNRQRLYSSKDHVSR